VEIAQNFVHYFVTPGYPATREDIGRTLILRATPFDWAESSWTGYANDRDKSRAEDCCGGFGHGFVEWVLPLEGADLSQARRVKLLCEASSRRQDVPQTDDDIYPTVLSITLNGIPMYEATLRDHPHDSRGVLSYWRGGVGAYGYFAHAAAEGEKCSKRWSPAPEKACCDCAAKSQKRPSPKTGFSCTDRSADATR
jgi:hypothetical protein